MNYSQHLFSCSHVLSCRITKISQIPMTKIVDVLLPQITKLFLIFIAFSYSHNIFTLTEKNTFL